MLPLRGPEKGWHMVKIDLKDAYLAIIIPIILEHQCPMSTPIGDEEWTRVKYLPFKLCTAPFIFLKLSNH